MSKCVIYMMVLTQMNSICISALGVCVCVCVSVCVCVRCV